MKLDCKTVKAWPKTIAQDLVPVQPMAFPSSVIFHLESSYKVKHGLKTPTLNESKLKEIKP
jgi:hypothetical protein